MSEEEPSEQYCCNVCLMKRQGLQEKAVVCGTLRKALFKIQSRFLLS